MSEALKPEGAGKDATLSSPAAPRADMDSADKAVVASAGLDLTDVVKVHSSPAGMAIVTAANHAVTDPGDALPVSIQRGISAWQPTSDQPDPVDDDGAQA